MLTKDRESSVPSATKAIKGLFNVGFFWTEFHFDM